MELTFEKKNEIGFQYVLDMLEPCSCYGSARIRNLSSYSSDEKDELQAELDNVEKAISAIDQFSPIVNKINHSFMHLKDVRPIVKKCQITSLNEVELFEIKRFLLTFRDIFPAFNQINDKISFIGLTMRDLSSALKIVDPDNTGVPSFHISESCSDKLGEIRREKKRIETLIRSGQGNKDDLHIERTKIAAREEEAELEVKKMMSDSLRIYLDDILFNVESITRLDLILSKALLAKTYSACKPIISEGIIRMKNMVNPKISGVLAEKGKNFTPVTIQLKRGATVVTGANMGGKSVALKTVALNTLLALCGIYPFAEEAEVSLIDDLYIISEDLESIDRGLSSFGGEILEFNIMSRRLNAKSLILLDEFARGTNPDEGAAIVRATTQWLQKKESFAILSTHYDNVAELAGAHYQVIGLKDISFDSLKKELASIDVSKGADRIAEHMNYGLYRVEVKQDCPKDALNICKLLDLDPEIVQLAENYY